jgi:hypothetical protein
MAGAEGPHERRDRTATFGRVLASISGATAFPMVVGASVLTLFACGGGSAAGLRPSPSRSPSVSAMPCTALPGAVGAGGTGSLAQTDSGRTFCVHVGQRLSVFLSVPVAQADSEAWTHISASDSAVLKGVPSGELTLARGVTAGFFVAARVGTTQLNSTHPPCNGSQPAGCPGDQRWQVTIVVTG